MTAFLWFAGKGGGGRQAPVVTGFHWLSMGPIV